MKVADLVVKFLVQQGIEYVFAVAGGASLHLIDAVDRNPRIDFVCTLHEQASSMAADAYSRITDNLGAAIATSGPGATNMLTGACSAYYDSIPVIYITGQVSTFRSKSDTGVRQIGFQETDTVDIFKPVTKYSVKVESPSRILFELEKAVHIAKSGRPGPVLIDIPDDIQRVDVAEDELARYFPQSIYCKDTRNLSYLERCLELIAHATRPVVIVGWGIRLAKAKGQLDNLLAKLKFPVAPTWAVADMFDSRNPLLIGTFGTHGTRYANFAVQNSDLVLAIGTRLDTKATGSPVNTFAREAKKIVVDIDAAELDKFGRFGLKIDLLVNSDAKDFLISLNAAISKTSIPHIGKWLERINKWKEIFPVCECNDYGQQTVNPYFFVKELSELLQSDDIVCVDTGCTVAWMMQAFNFKAGQRLIHDWNNTAMGWALPASIGVWFAKKPSRVICVTGDGSLMMNIQELGTIVKHDLPIKIILFNNHGYGMIQQTQDQWLDSRYLASSEKGGLGLPNFPDVGRAFGFKTYNINNNKDITPLLAEALLFHGPVFCNVEISSNHRVYPQVKFGRPNEDLEPLLDRKDFFENMIVPPLDISRT